jgi:hypothetical protein
VFAPIERLEDTAEGIWASLQGEKRALDCLISIAKQSFSVHCHLRRSRGTLKIVFQLELLSARASPQLREPDNLRTFVSSPLLGARRIHRSAHRRARTAGLGAAPRSNADSGSSNS